MDWADWTAVAFCVVLAVNGVVSLVRRRRAKREFKAWLKETQAKHKVGLS